MYSKKGANCCCTSSQLENLVYFNRLKHSKIVISDFHLAKLENGLIKDPCGTPEYLGKEQTEGERAQHKMILLTSVSVKAFWVWCV